MPSSTLWFPLLHLNVGAGARSSVPLEAVTLSSLLPGPVRTHHPGSPPARDVAEADEPATRPSNPHPFQENHHDHPHEARPHHHPIPPKRCWPDLDPCGTGANRARVDARRDAPATPRTNLALTQRRRRRPMPGGRLRCRAPERLDRPTRRLPQSARLQQPTRQEGAAPGRPKPQEGDPGRTPSCTREQGRLPSAASVRANSVV